MQKKHYRCTQAVTHVFCDTITPMDNRNHSIHLEVWFKVKQKFQSNQCQILPIIL